jgi:hypothetical protein
VRLVIDTDALDDATEPGGDLEIVIMRAVAREIESYGRLILESAEKVGAELDIERGHRVLAIAKEIRWVIRDGWTVPRSAT